ncbi:MAG: hypothetical protein WC835_00965 [Candidatus Paceibacterota bacterium]|jgi:hypothetical protein
MFDIINEYLEKLATKKSGLSFFGAAVAIVFVFSFFLTTTAHAQTSLSSITDAATCAQSGGVWDSYVGCQAQNNVSGATSATACAQSGGVWDDYLGCQAPVLSGQTAGGDTSTSGGEAAAKAAASKAAAEKALQDKCGSTFFSVISDPVNCLLPYVANWALGMAGYLLWMAGVFLNYSAVFTLNLSEFAAKLNIDTTWATIRDMMNIVFIFTLLWVSINTILGLGNDAKKLLASIIISALLINFSLFFTKVVIDVSNVVALQFYTGITGGKFIGPSASMDGGISDQFMARLKLTSIYDAGRSGASVDGTTGEIAALTAGNVVTSAIMGTIFVIITAFVFFTAGLMLAARSAILVILMVTSPIGFIGGFIPKLATYTKKWQDELANQALFAPVFFMLIWMILKMTESKTGGETAVSFAAAIAGGKADFISVIFNYVVLIAFIIAALNVAKDMSGKAGAAFSKFGATAMGSIAGGAGGWALRKSLGSLSQAAARSEGLKNFSEKAGLGGFVGRMALSTAKFGQSTSFDARALADTKVGKAAGYIAGQAGANVDFGKAGGAGGRKATYERQVKEKETARKEEAEALKAEIMPEDDKATITTKKAAEAARLSDFAERVKGGTIFDKVKMVTLSKTAVRGSTKAAVGVEKDLKKRQDQEKNLKSRGDRIEAVKVALGAAGVPGMTKDSMDADVINHYQAEVKKVEKDLQDKLTGATAATPDQIEKAEKLVKLYKGKLSEFEGDMKERDRIGEALGKKPEEKKP